MSDDRVNLFIKPQEYFREKLQTAQGQMHTNLDEELSFYIVNLLVEYITPPQITEDGTENTANIMDYPLAILLKHALEAPPRKRYQIFKHLGDTSLYMSGFFQDYFNRKTFDIGYYITMGQTAYYQVSSLAQEVDRDSAKSGVYKNLSQNFGVCVELLSCVSDVPGLRQNKDILGVYERWHRTHSRRLYQILVEAGITPIPSEIKSAS